MFSRAVASGLPFQFDQRQRCIDGEYRRFETRGVPIRDHFGRIARWYVLLTDIEDRTRALAQLEQMQSDFAHMNRVSMMGELTASLYHEISQPIAAARNYARAALNFLICSLQTWARLRNSSALSWALPIDPEKSSAGSASKSKRRLCEKGTLILMRRSMKCCY